MKTSELEKMVTDKVSALTSDIVLRKGAFYGDSRFNPKHLRAIEIHKSASKKENVIDFQKRCDDMLLLSIIMQKPVQETKLYKSYRQWLDNDASELAKAMDTSTGGAGADWIPTDFSRQLEDMLNLERVLASAIPHITMTTDPYKIPTKKTRSTAYKGTQNTAPTASNPGTGSVTFSASKIITYVPLSYELDEDSIVDMMSVIKQDLVESLAYAEEDCLMNGDTTAPHQDSDITAADDVRKCYKGIRKHCLANNYKKDLSTFTSLTLAQMKGSMKKYGIKSNKLAWAAGPLVLAKLLNLKDDQNNAVVISMDKLGSNATVLQGQLGVLFGAPVLPVESMRENLNIAGVYDGSSTVRGTIALVYLPGWKLGERGSITAETERIVKQQSIDMVASKREDFQPVHDITTEPIAYLGYNISL